MSTTEKLNKIEAMESGDDLGDVNYCNDAISEELRTSRRMARVTLRELSKKINISIGELADLEHGRKMWTPELRDLYLKSL